MTVTVNIANKFIFGLWLSRKMGEGGEVINIGRSELAARLIIDDEPS